MSWSVWMSPAVTGPGPFLCRRSSATVARVHAQRDALQVQQDVDDVFLHALDAVYSCSTPSISTSVIARAGHRRQQHAPQRVAQRVAETALERLDHDPRLARRTRGCTLTTRGFRNS